MSKDVSIIFINYKTKDLTINAIKSVFEKTQGIDFEIFVVDNNSQDGSIEAIEEEFPNINIIKNQTNAGFGAANNIAIKQATGKYILCLNTDTLLVNNAIKIMYDFMEQEDNQNTGACGGYLYNEKFEPTAAGGNFPNVIDLLLKFKIKFPSKIYYKYAVALLSNDIINKKEVDNIIGADIFFRKSVLDKVGLFDEKFFMYLEETDLCYRIKQANYKIKFVEKAKIIHLEGKSTKNKTSSKKMFKKSQFMYLRKHKPNDIIKYKILYFILYLIDWLFLGNKESLELLKEVIIL